MTEVDRITCPGCGVGNTYTVHCQSPTCTWWRCLTCKAVWTKTQPTRWMRPFR